MSNPISKLEDSKSPVPRRKVKLSFRGNKGLLLVAALLVVVMALSWGGLGKIKEQVRFDIRETLLKVDSTTHELIHIWVDDRIDDALMIVDRPDVRQLITELLALPRDNIILADSSSLEQLRIIVKPLLDKHSYLGMFVIAPDGVNIASMRDTNLGRVNFFSEYQNYFKNLLNGKAQLVLPLRSDVALPGVTGKLSKGEPTMFIGVPVMDNNGSVMAAFTIRIDPAHEFTRIVQMARIGLTGDSYAFDQNGKLITNSRFDDQLRTIGLIKEDEHSILNMKLLDPGGNLLQGFLPTVSRGDLPLTFMAQNAITGSGGVNLKGYRDYRGVMVVGGWSWHEKYNFGQAFELDMTEAYGSYFAIRRTVIGLLAIIIFLFLGLSARLVRGKRQADAMNKQLAREMVEREKSEVKFRMLLESSPDGLIIADKAGNIILVNRQVERLFGYSSEELLGQKIEMLIPKRFAVGHPENRDKFFKDPHIRPMGQDLDLWGLHKDGQELAVEIALSPVETDGKIAAIASIRDITKRKRIEEKIKKSEAGLSQAQRIAHIGNWELDIASNTLHWSDEVYRIFGRNPQEFEATYEAFLDHIHPDDREMVNKAYTNSLKDKTPYEIIHRVKLADGTIKHIHERCETDYDLIGTPFRSVGTVQDISKQVKADGELARHRERLEELVAERTSELHEREETLTSITSSAQNAIIMIDNDGNISFWNKAAQRIFGRKAKEVIGENLHKLIAPTRYHKDHLAAFQNFQNTGKGNCIGDIIELSGLRRDGKEFPIELALSAVKIKDKWNAIGIISDITDRKKAEADLRRNMDELERFSKLAMGREQQMIRLKEEINSLLKVLGKKEKYKIVRDL